MNMHAKFPLTLLVSVGALALVAGCSGSDPAVEMSAEQIDVPTQVAGQLDGVGIPVDVGSLDCPDGLATQAGSTVTCEFTSEGQPVGLVVTVDQVDGSSVTTSLATEARPVPKVTLEGQIQPIIEAQLGSALSAVVCDGDLDATVDATANCTLASSDSTRDVTATVTGVEGGLVTFSLSDA